MGREDGLQQEIEHALSGSMPDVEVLLAERPSPGRVRVFIDRPGGVDIALCERVSRELSAFRERYALEVSSPGLDRPLAKPEHFRRAIGQRVSVRTAAPIGGRRRFRGGLVAADDNEIELDQDGTPMRIPYSAIRRGNVVLELAGGTR